MLASSKLWCQSTRSTSVLLMHYRICSSGSSSWCKGVVFPKNRFACFWSSQRLCRNAELRSSLLKFRQLNQYSGGRFFSIKCCPWDFSSEVPLSPPYLIEPLAAALIRAGEIADKPLALETASQLLSQFSLEVAHLASVSTADSCMQLDGLMDLSPPNPIENYARASRRRLHQSLHTLVRYFSLDPEVYLQGAGAAAASGPAQLRRYAAHAIYRKALLRNMCKRGVPYSTIPPRQQWVQETNDIKLRGPTYTAPVQASSAIAGVHGLKQWNRNFHEWCAMTASHYFLQDRVVRSRWVTGGRDARSRMTLLTQELRQIATRCRQQGLPRFRESEWQGVIRQTAIATLPPVGTRLRLLDVGSCANFFGLEAKESFEVTAVDLVPGHPTVFACDFLELRVGDVGSSIETDGNCVNDIQILRQLPAGHYDVAILALLLSVLPGPEARGVVIAKVRQLLRSVPNRGLLIIADTAGTVGRHGAPDSRKNDWVRAVEANGFRLASDPQMHLSRLREKLRGGFSNRAFCWSFVTAPDRGKEFQPVPVPLLIDPRLHSTVKEMRDARLEARKEKKKLLSAAKAGSVNARRQLRRLCR